MGSPSNNCGATTSLSEIDSGLLPTDNGSMEIPGRVKNGVIVLEGRAVLPEGAPVTVLFDRVRIWHKSGKKIRVAFPLVRSKQPGTLHLSNERIAEILQEDDLTSVRESLRQPPE
jgi:hypothetical protein